MKIEILYNFIPRGQIQKWNNLEYHVANGVKMSAYLSTTTGHSSLELHVRVCCHPAAISVLQFVPAIAISRYG